MQVKCISIYNLCLQVIQVFKHLTLPKSHMHALKHTYISTVIFNHMQLLVSHSSFQSGWLVTKYRLEL